MHFNTHWFAANGSYALRMALAHYLHCKRGMEATTKNIEHFAKVFIALFGAGAWEFARRVMNKIEEIDNADSQ